MTVDARRSVLRWLIAGAVLVALGAAAVTVIALRSAPRDLPEATIVRDCPDPSGGPPERPESRRAGPLVPTGDPATVRLCRGDPARDSAPLPYRDLTRDTGRLVEALNALPTTAPAACTGTLPPRIVDLVLDYPSGRVVVAVSTAGCGPVHTDGQTRYGARQVLELAEGLIEQG